MADLIPFAYHNYAIRTMQKDDGSSWWVATELCAAVHIRNVSQACSRLDDDEKDTICFTDSEGRPHELLIISESGLYKLLMRSNKEEAKSFQRWVTHEVLPQIRKTGSYGQPTTPAVLNPEHQLMIDMIVQLDRTEQRAKAAEATAARAEGKADMALADARTMTLEEFVLSNGLLRQMPEAHWPSYVTWLKDVCLARGHDFSKGQVLGKRWQMENVYPLQALCALKHHVQTKPTQLALVRQREQEGHA